MKIKFLNAQNQISLSSCLGALIAEALFQKMRQEECVDDENQDKNREYSTDEEF